MIHFMEQEIVCEPFQPITTVRSTKKRKGTKKPYIRQTVVFSRAEQYEIMAQAMEKIFVTGYMGRTSDEKR